MVEGEAGVRCHGNSGASAWDFLLVAIWRFLHDPFPGPNKVRNASDACLTGWRADRHDGDGRGEGTRT